MSPDLLNLLNSFGLLNLDHSATEHIKQEHLNLLEMFRPDPTAARYFVKTYEPNESNGPGYLKSKIWLEQHEVMMNYLIDKTTLETKASGLICSELNIFGDYIKIIKIPRFITLP